MAAGLPSGFGRKLGIAIGCGFIVAISAVAVDVLVIQFNREVLIHQLAGDVMAFLVTALVCLALQLRNEELHYRFAMERAAIVAELNHHVRNAVFPLCLAVQRSGDAEAQRLSNEAVERINIAMKEAATDVFAMKLNYAPQPRPVEMPEKVPPRGVTLLR
ncbi:MAG: hypothetical protein ACR2IF_00555 [Terriglobales bacterium]